jgi:hypothetical protein
VVRLYENGSDIHSLESYRPDPTKRDNLLGIAAYVHSHGGLDLTDIIHFLLPRTPENTYQGFGFIVNCNAVDVFKMYVKYGHRLEKCMYQHNITKEMREFQKKYLQARQRTIVLLALKKRRLIHFDRFLIKELSLVLTRGPYN